MILFFLSKRKSHLFIYFHLSFFLENVFILFDLLERIKFEKLLNALPLITGMLL